MASSDWPDYTHGVVLSDGSVTDCPDWQEQVVGPGGTPISGGGGLTLLGAISIASSTSFAYSGELILGSVTLVNTAGQVVLMFLVVEVDWADSYYGTGDGVTASLQITTGRGAGGMFCAAQDVPGLPIGTVVAARQPVLIASAPVQLTNANATVTLQFFHEGANISGTVSPIGTGGSTAYGAMIYAI